MIIYNTLKSKELSSIKKEANDEFVKELQLRIKHDNNRFSHLNPLLSNFNQNLKENLVNQSSYYENSSKINDHYIKQQKDWIESMKRTSLLKLNAESLEK
jgi:hypothetical protein